MVWDEDKLKQCIRLCEEQIALQDSRIKMASKERVFWSAELKHAKDSLFGVKQLELLLG